VHIACCQLNIVWENKPANHSKVLKLLEKNKLPQNSLMILPEMFATGFSMNVDVISDSETKETHFFLSRTATEFGIYLLGGIVSQDTTTGKGLNEAVIYSPDGKEISRYCKIHPFTYGGETEHYMAGEKVQSIQLMEFKMAPFICYDLRFPEVFRRAMLEGVNLFVVIANWPSSREHHWITLLKARAIENQVYVAAVNRCGSDPKLNYSGRSMIIDPRGFIINEATDEEIIISGTIDLQSVIDYRNEFPVLKDAKLDD
jgi:omega-amidase